MMTRAQVDQRAVAADRRDAQAAVLRARLKLMLDQPYLASAIARLPLVDATDTDWCPTAATDGYYIYVNYAFTETLDEADVAFVIAHEVLHCVLGHIDRRGTRDRHRWNIAIDYATNALLAETGFQPPALALYERRYVGLTAEAIYESLPTTVKRLPGSHAGATGGYDLHLDVGDLEGSSTRSGFFPSQEERARIRATIGRELYSQLPGRIAGYWAAEIEVGTERTVSWQELLSRFVSGLRRDDYRLFPPNHKHLWRGLYLPSVGVPAPRHLVVAVDTSGSMSTEQLSQVFGEIDALRSTFECRITVLQCDVVIQHVEDHEPWEELAPVAPNGARRTVYGRGGTDLRPPFAWIEEQNERNGELPDAIIYCTDGFGPFPTDPPDGVHVLWVLTHSGVEDTPFGTQVRLPEAPR